MTLYLYPDSVKTIGHYAFRYCEGLRSIHIPASVTSVGVRAFADCPYLHEFYFYGTHQSSRIRQLLDSEYITVIMMVQGGVMLKAYLNILHLRHGSRESTMTAAPMLVAKESITDKRKIW